MLDLTKLGQQLQQASFDLAGHQRVLSARRALALATWERALANEESLLDKLLNARGGLPWIVARPLEGLGDYFGLPPEPPRHLVLAADGSQIAPSRHEISPYYLINVSRICYRYGTGERPLQESEPYLYYREQDLYARVQHQHLKVSEQMIGIERSLMEFRELAKLAGELGQVRDPLVALVDGGLYSLLPDLTHLPGQIQEQSRARLLASLQDLQAARVPVCAYTSQPGKSECLQLLRLMLCPYDQARCSSTCPPGSNDEPPCTGLMPMSDRELWQWLLQPGERSPLFASTAPLPEGFQGQELCFFYLHTGYEIARLEFPRWVAEKRDWLEWLHVLSWLQVQKGRGYPIALAEAHNQAVIKAPDRARFYALLARRLAHDGSGVALSYKELKKRKGLV